VRLIGADNEALGLMSSREAMEIARNRELDLVCISEAANPPVCRIMNYGKFKYEQAKKEKENKKKQTKTSVKEIKLHPRIEKHDYDFKIKHAKAFLIKGHRVKMNLVFRGRENMYKDLGLELMKKVDVDLEALGTAEAGKKFIIEGRSMITNYNPDAKKIKQYEKEHPDEFPHLQGLKESEKIEKDNEKIENEE
jgi:translation initiation factor IF-3